MRILLRSIAILSVLAVPVLAAHADTFSGTAAFSDTSPNSNNNFNFTGSFATPISFSGGVGATYTDALTILVGNVHCTHQSPCGSSATDALTATIDFTAPSTVDGGFTGTGDDYTTFNGFVDNQNIDWSTNTQTLNFADGSSVLLSLPNFTASESYWGSSQSEDLTITVESVPTCVPTAAAPEPSSLILLGTGILGMAGVMRRRFVL